MSKTVNVKNALDRIETAQFDDIDVITPGLKGLRDQLIMHPPPAGDQGWNVLRAAVEAREAQLSEYQAEISNLRLWHMLVEALIWDAQGITDGFDEDLCSAVDFARNTNDTKSLEGIFDEALQELEQALDQRA